MLRAHRLSALLPALAVSALAAGALALDTITFADDAPPANSAPPAEGTNGRHHDAAWAACRKQADDQKLAPGDARKDFMRNCIKTAKGTATTSS
jgi:hypothetical protein